MKRNFSLFIVATLLILIGIIAIPKIQQITSRQPSNEEFIQAITKKFPDFIDGDTPVIAIDSVSRHDYVWYIVTIKSKDKVETFVPVKLVLHNFDSNLSVSLGPDTSFTDTEIKTQNLPESVILELRK